MLVAVLPLLCQINLVMANAQTISCGWPCTLMEAPGVSGREADGYEVEERTKGQVKMTLFPNNSSARCWR